jgi:hypothetical protein
MKSDDFVTHDIVTVFEFFGDRDGHGSAKFHWGAALVINDLG